MGLGFDRPTTSTGKCLPLRCHHVSVQLAVREPQGVKLNWKLIALETRPAPSPYHAACR
jgi:hypothetical protein